MNTVSRESPVRRLLVLLGVIIAVVGAAAWVYMRVVESSTPQLDQAAAMHIIHAAQSYTESLHRQGLPIPPSVSLDDLVKLQLLKPEDAAPFAGLTVTMALTATGTNGPGAMMRVHFPNAPGDDVVLLEDGTWHPVPPSAATP